MHNDPSLCGATKQMRTFALASTLLCLTACGLVRPKPDPLPPAVPATKVERITPPSEYLKHVDYGPLPNTVGGTVDFSPTCKAAVDKANSQFDSIIQWIAEH